MRIAVQEGVRVQVTVQGSGSPVVIWPFLGRSTRDYAQLATALADHGAMAIGINPRGVGESDGAGLGISPRGHAADLAAVLEALGIDRVHLFGDGHGSQVVRAFSARWPERVASLMLNGSGGEEDPSVSPAVRMLAPVFFRGLATPTNRTQAGLRTRIGRRWSRHMLQTRYIAPGHAIPTMLLRDWWPEPAAGQFAGMASERLPEWADRWSGPVLHLQGMKDHLSPPEQGARWRQRVGEDRVQLVQITAAGHSLWAERPRPVIQAVLDFLAQCPALPSTEPVRSESSAARDGFTGEPRIRPVPIGDAGPVGSLLALLLARTGAAVAVEHDGVACPEGAVLSAAALRSLEHLLGPDSACLSGLLADYEVASAIELTADRPPDPQRLVQVRGRFVRVDSQELTRRLQVLLVAAGGEVHWRGKGATRDASDRLEHSGASSSSAGRLPAGPSAWRSTWTNLRMPRGMADRLGTPNLLQGPVDVWLGDAHLRIVPLTDTALSRYELILWGKAPPEDSALLGHEAIESLLGGAAVVIPWRSVRALPLELEDSVPVMERWIESWPARTTRPSPTPLLPTIPTGDPSFGQWLDLRVGSSRRLDGAGPHLFGPHRPSRRGRLRKAVSRYSGLIK